MEVDKSVKWWEIYLKVNRQLDHGQVSYEDGKSYRMYVAGFTLLLSVFITVVSVPRVLGILAAVVCVACAVWTMASLLSLFMYINDSKKNGDNDGFVSNIQKVYELADDMKKKRVLFDTLFVISLSIASIVLVIIKVKTGV